MRHKNGQATDRQTAAPEIAQVDAVETLKVSLYGVAVVAKKGEERSQFPETPTASWIAPKRSFRSEVLRGFERNFFH